MKRKRIETLLMIGALICNIIIFIYACAGTTKAYAFMTAKEARHQATRERVLRERSCSQAFKEHIEEKIDLATTVGDNFVNTDFYLCPHGLYAIANKLRKMGYKVKVKSERGYDDNIIRKYLVIRW